MSLRQQLPWWVRSQKPRGMEGTGSFHRYPSSNGGHVIPESNPTHSKANMLPSPPSSPPYCLARKDCTTVVPCLVGTLHLGQSPMRIAAKSTQDSAAPSAHLAAPGEAHTKGPRPSRQAQHDGGVGPGAGWAQSPAVLSQQARCRQYGQETARGPQDRASWGSKLALHATPLPKLQPAHPWPGDISPGDAKPFLPRAHPQLFHLHPVPPFAEGHVLLPGIGLPLSVPSATSQPSARPLALLRSVSASALLSSTTTSPV